jgi:hypothetical protein
MSFLKVISSINIFGSRNSPAAEKALSAAKSFEAPSETGISNLHSKAVSALTKNRTQLSPAERHNANAAVSGLSNQSKKQFVGKSVASSFPVAKSKSAKQATAPANTQVKRISPESVFNFKSMHAQMKPVQYRKMVTQSTISSSTGHDVSVAGSDSKSIVSQSGFKSEQPAKTLAPTRQVAQLSSEASTSGKKYSNTKLSDSFVDSLIQTMSSIQGRTLGTSNPDFQKRSEVSQNITQNLDEMKQRAMGTWKTP